MAAAGFNLMERLGQLDEIQGPPAERSIIIAARCHGEIGVLWRGAENIPDLAANIGEIIQYVEKPRQLTEFNILSNTPMGDVCYGNPNVEEFIRNLSELPIQGYNMRQYISDVLQNRHRDIRIAQIISGFIRPIESRLYSDLNRFINKAYTPYGGGVAGSGFHLVHHHGISEIERVAILDSLRRQTEYLNGGHPQEHRHILRSELISSVIQGTNVNKLTLCDFTCDRFRPMEASRVRVAHGIFERVPNITQPMYEWLVSQQDIGKKMKKKKKSKKITKKRKRNKRKQKNKSTTRR